MSTGKREKKTAGQFILLPHALIKSIAWRSLTPPARVLYIEIELRYNGHNNGRIGFSVRQAASAVRVNKDTAGKAFKDLQRVGLIRAIRGSSFDTDKVNRATEWEIVRQTGKWDAMKWRGPEDDYPVFDGSASHMKRNRSKKSQSDSEGPSVRKRGTDDHSGVPILGTSCPKEGDPKGHSTKSPVRSEGTHIDTAMEGNPEWFLEFPCRPFLPSEDRSICHGSFLGETLRRFGGLCAAMAVDTTEVNA